MLLISLHDACCVMCTMLGVTVVCMHNCVHEQVLISRSLLNVLDVETLSTHTQAQTILKPPSRMSVFVVTALAVTNYHVINYPACKLLPVQSRS